MLTKSLGRELIVITLVLCVRHLTGWLIVYTGGNSERLFANMTTVIPTAVPSAVALCGESSQGETLSLTLASGGLKRPIACFCSL